MTRRNRSALPVFFLAALAALGGCGSSRDAAPPVEGEGAEAAEELHLEPEMVSAWGIETTTLVRAPVAGEVVLPGTLGLNENRSAEIGSYVSGKVTAVHTDLGRRVRPGQALITLNSPEFARAQSEFVSARARMVLSEQEFDRARSLLDQQAIEEREFRRRETEYQQSVTEFGAAESLLHSLGLNQSEINELLQGGPEVWLDETFHAGQSIVLRAPIAGTVIAREVVLGQQVEPEQTLLKLSDLTRLWAHLDAYEPDLPYLESGMRVSITTSIDPVRTFEGTITYVGDTVSAELRTVPVRVEVANQEGLLRPNMFVEGRITTPPSDEAVLSVPEDAIQILEGEPSVFVQIEEEHASPTDPTAGEEEEDHVVFAVRHIVTGSKIGSRRVVVAGLQEGDRVVVAGVFELKAELQKGSGGHAHVH